MCTRSTLRRPPNLEAGNEWAGFRLHQRLWTARFNVWELRRKVYAFDAKTGALKWKFTTDGERRFRSKRVCTDGNRRTRPSPIRLMCFSRALWWQMALCIRKRRPEIFTRWKRRQAICAGNSKNRRCRALFAGARGWRFVFRKVGQLISMQWTLRQEKRNGVSTEAKTR